MPIAAEVNHAGVVAATGAHEDARVVHLGEAGEHFLQEAFFDF